MIDKQSLTLDWIASKKELYQRADPSIMEKVVFALYLLEQLTISGIPFVFKGGTSLMLLLNEARRFSIDIDIILSPQTTQGEIEHYLSKMLADGVFLRYELDIRRSFLTNIPKAHYKFFYQSVVADKEQEILLDILLEKAHYPVFIQKPITSHWIQHQEPALSVSVPDINSIAGDKLTAYAPNTIGILYGKEKECEIIKQLFDVGVLFDQIDNLQIFKKSFIAMAETELIYRNQPHLTTKDVLDDIIQTGLLIANREKQSNAENKVKYNELATGISQFKYYLFMGSFRIEEAQTASAKAAYLAAIIKTDYQGELNRFHPELPLASYMIQHPEYNFLNRKLKNVPNGALFYWHHALKLLNPQP